MQAHRSFETHSRAVQCSQGAYVGSIRMGKDDAGHVCLTLCVNSLQLPETSPQGLSTFR